MKIKGFTVCAAGWALAAFYLVAPPAWGVPLIGAKPAFQQSTSAKGGAAPNSNPQAWFGKGQAALQAGDLDAAEAAFRKVIAGDPRSGAAYSNLGVIAMRRKEWDRAITFFKE